MVFIVFGVFMHSFPANTHPLQAGLCARDAVYRAREDWAASKFYAKKAKDKAERLAEALENGRQLVAKLLDQAKAVCSRYIPTVRYIQYIQLVLCSNTPSFVQVCTILYCVAMRQYIARASTLITQKPSRRKKNTTWEA